MGSNKTFNTVIFVQNQFQIGPFVVHKQSIHRAATKHQEGFVGDRWVQQHQYQQNGFIGFGSLGLHFFFFQGFVTSFFGVVEVEVFLLFLLVNIIANSSPNLMANVNPMGALALTANLDMKGMAMVQAAGILPNKAVTSKFTMLVL